MVIRAVTVVQGGTGGVDAMTNWPSSLLRILCLGIGTFGAMMAIEGPGSPAYADEVDAGPPRLALDPVPSNGGRFELELRETRQRAMELVFPNDAIGRVRIWVDDELATEIAGFSPGGTAVVGVPLRPGRNQLNIQIRGRPVDEPDAETVIWEYLVPIRFAGSVPDPIYRVAPYDEDQALEVLERFRKENDGASDQGGFHRSDSVNPSER